MFSRFFADARSHVDLVNAVATGLTRFARVALRTDALTHRERVNECLRLVDLYRAVVWARIVDDTNEAGEIAILLCCVTSERGSEWQVARQLRNHYIFN